MSMRAILVLGLLCLAGCELDPTAAELPAEPEESLRFEVPYSSTTGGACEPDAPGLSLAQARVDSTSWTSVHRTVDDETADIARQVPGGYGGRFKEDGLMTISLVHPELKEEAIAALLMLRAGVGHAPRVKKGRWDFGQMYDWNRYLKARGIWSIDGVHSSSIHESANRLHYGVTLEGLVPLSAFLGSLQVPCELLVLSVGPNNAFDG